MRRRLSRGAIFLAVAVTIQRLILWIGMLLLLGWSYSVWGNELTPLAALLWPALVMLALALGLRIFIWTSLRWFQRARWLAARRRRIQKDVRLSRAEGVPTGQI